MITPPLEIVNDPIAYNPEVSERYHIDERANKLKGHINLTRANTEAYLRGQAGIEDLIRLELVDNK